MVKYEEDCNTGKTKGIFEYQCELILLQAGLIWLKISDMFQIGRSTEPPIDMVLIDIQPGASAKSGSRTVLPEQSTISRFSCRIVCQREPPFTARIYAAGFDASNRIFLGESLGLPR